MPERPDRAALVDVEEIRARTPLAALVSRRVKLARSGRDWVGCCPFHGERTPSFHVFADNHFHCFGCGAHGDAIDFIAHTQGLTFRDAVKLLADEAGIVTQLESSPAAAPVARPVDDLERARKIARGAAIYRASVRDPRVETYLASRGCGGLAPAALRFHPNCPRPSGDGVERLPAMVAPITDPASNSLVGTHCTFLRPDGSGKIEQGAQKIMWGSWGVIRLTLDEDVTLGLGLCEGIETALTIMRRAGWGAVWAAGCAGAIAKFPVLAGIECLTLFPDLDDRGAGQEAARVCADRWAAAGREVQTIFPPGGSDWNDALTRRAA